MLAEYNMSFYAMVRDFRKILWWDITDDLSVLTGARAQRQFISNNIYVNFIILPCHSKLHTATFWVIKALVEKFIIILCCCAQMIDLIQWIYQYL